MVDHNTSMESSRLFDTLLPLSQTKPTPKMSSDLAFSVWQISVLRTYTSRCFQNFIKHLRIVQQLLISQPWSDDLQCNRCASHHLGVIYFSSAPSIQFISVIMTHIKPALKHQPQT